MIEQELNNLSPEFGLLLSKLEELATTQPLQAKGTSSGRFGLAIEEALGIEQNSSKSPDFMGIEIKTKASAKLQTLFSRTPSQFVNFTDSLSLLKRYGYQRDGRIKLYTSMNIHGDSLGFSILSNSNSILVSKDGQDCIEFNHERLKEALHLKHKNSAFIDIATTRGSRDFYLKSVCFCQTARYENFLRLLEQGYIYLDLTLSIKNNKAKDHGYLWRIPGHKTTELFDSTSIHQLS